LAFNKLTLFPNPTLGAFTLNTNDLPASSGVIKVYNAMGQVVQERKIEDLTQT